MRWPAFIALPIFALAGVPVGCDSKEPAPLPSAHSTPAAADPAWFEDATARTGLDFAQEPGSPETYFMPQSMGSGAAMIDLDNDGRLDLYLVQMNDAKSRSPNRLYRQDDRGKFIDVTQGSGVDAVGIGVGVAAGDVNNDGLTDLLLLEYGGAKLFLNKGAMKFTDITAAAGIDNPAWGVSAAFTDYDRDGLLDLVIANYLVYSASRICADQAGRRDFCGPAGFAGSAARLFRNLGAAGDAPVRFEDVTLKSGLAAAPSSGMAVVALDFTGDRWPDFFITNDGRPNHLWVNQRDGTFKEVAALAGVAVNGMGRADANMGIAAGDRNGDGLIDLYVTHLYEEKHTYFQQGPAGIFLDRTSAVGLATPRWRSTGFGTVTGDFDCDGKPDLAQVNGRVRFANGPSPPGKPFWDVYAERNQLFAGDGAEAFRDVSESNDAFCRQPGVGRGLAMGDVDNDGALDLLATYVSAPARLYRNIAPRRGHWLSVRAVDPKLGGRDMLGATITLRTQRRTWTGFVNSAHSYAVANDPRVHFGLGEHDRVDWIDVVWPDGGDETFPGVAVDQSITLTRGKGKK